MAAIFGRFSRTSEYALIEAQKLAERLARPVQSDILVMVLVGQNSTPVSELLKQAGTTYTKLLENLLPVEQTSAITNEMQYVLEESIKLASKYRFNLVEIELILYVIARDENLSGYNLLKRSGVDPSAIITRLSEWLVTVSTMMNNGRMNMTQPGQQPEELDIEKYTVNMSEQAEAGELDPVIGRTAEIDQLIHILLRRRKNNPLLLGEPGVGKTALVDALAQRIASKNVPQPLLNKHILNLDLSAVVAGTMYRGQFEERLKNILQEVAELGNCILFVDEIHTLSGTGGSEGGFDAANILKPALARGEISLIGATTHEEYRKYIRKDKALDRRFQTIQVSEPTPAEALTMLKGMKSVLEKYHSVSIDDAALKAAVQLSSRYIHDRFLPDKAIDILDEAATYHVKTLPVNAAVSDLQKEISLVSMQKAEVVERANTPDDWALAKELSAKETQLLNTLQQFHQKEKKKLPRTQLTAHDVAFVVAKRTGIPLSHMEIALEPLQVRSVIGKLQEHILGQEVAIATIGKALTRAQLGLQPEKKPLGSFLLVGPTGVGKTETARVIAKEVFGDSNALIKVDMSEYMERHTVSNLIGAPAGYVGYEQGGSLTEQVSRRPYAVVLFDEVEKAHPDVFNMLLQVLEDGVLTDNTGRQISFAHTIILMTSNIGMQSFNQAARIGFTTGEKAQNQQELESHIEKELKDFFRPELLGRLSATVYYQPLLPNVVQKLIRNRFDELKKNLRGKNVKISAEASFFHWAVEQYNPESGARSIDKLFLHTVEPALIDVLLDQHERQPLLLKALHGILTVENVATPIAQES